MAMETDRLAVLASALARVDAHVAAVGVQGEHVAAQLEALATRMQSAFALLAGAPDDVESDALRAELEAAAHLMTTLATRCLLDLTRARALLVAGAEPLTGPSSRPTTQHA